MSDDRTTRRGTDAPATADAAEHGDSALKRWSRRKREAAADTGPGSKPGPVAAPTTKHSAEATDEEPLSELPPLETITETSDVSAFLRPGVDEAVQRLALRRVFHSARFNVTDGLDVYADNYRNFEALGDIVTADMRYHAERLAREAERLAGGADTPDNAASGPDVAEETGPGAARDGLAGPSGAQDGEQDDEDEGHA